MGRRMEWAWKAVQAITTVVAGFWCALPGFTQLLVLLMIVDVVLGTMLAFRNRDYSVKAAREGANRKVGALLLVLVAGLLNHYIPLPFEVDLVQAASAFYVVAEMGSISRNAAALDIPVFVQFKQVMRYFQAQSGEDSNEETPK